VAAEEEEVVSIMLAVALGTLPESDLAAWLTMPATTANTP
jgi:hypothetical protein